MKTFSCFVCLCACCLSILSACAQQPQAPQAPPDESAAAESAIRAADAAWSKTAEAKQLDAMVGYYADNAIALIPNTPMATGKDAVRKVLEPMFAAPGFSLSWKVTNAGAAKSGDLGWTVGTYELTMNDSKGNPRKDQGKYFTQWKKQPDGSWKSIVDGFNSDMPAAPAAAPAPKK